jgi:hypothetical protein
MIQDSLTAAWPPQRARSRSTWRARCRPVVRSHDASKTASTWLRTKKSASLGWEKTHCREKPSVAPYKRDACRLLCPRPFSFCPSAFRGHPFAAPSEFPRCSTWVAGQWSPLHRPQGRLATRRPRRGNVTQRRSHITRDPLWRRVKNRPREDAAHESVSRHRCSGFGSRL